MNSEKIILVQAYLRCLPARSGSFQLWGRDVLHPGLRCRTTVRMQASLTNTTVQGACSLDTYTLAHDNLQTLSSQRVSSHSLQKHTSDNRRDIIASVQESVVGNVCMISISCQAISSKIYSATNQLAAVSVLSFFAAVHKICVAGPYRVTGQQLAAVACRSSNRRLAERC